MISLPPSVPICSFSRSNRLTRILIVQFGTQKGDQRIQVIKPLARLLLQDLLNTEAPVRLFVGCCFPFLPAAQQVGVVLHFLFARHWRSPQDVFATRRKCGFGAFETRCLDTVYHQAVWQLLGKN
jgi:hypothetical protein